MGLAGPKKRSKLSHDPNNTAWARSTTNFGHKILASQGWTPGDTLGAKDAAHASHYTKASSSHVRVMLKEDNLGLGAKLSGNNAETFGLSLFSGILGRLNGKSDTQLEKEQTVQRDVELALYQGRKHGSMNFVSAGFLVGDKIEPKSVALAPAPKIVVEAVEEVEPAAPTAEVAGKKRKATELGKESEHAESSRKSRKSKKSKKEQSSDGSESDKKSSSDDKKRRKDKKRKAVETSESEGESRAERKARKAERRARKEEKRRRKEEKRASASATPSTAPATPAEPVEVAVAVVTQEDGAQQVPAVVIGRHAVRQRYIAQKRLAHLNPQALKEIFMVKTTS